MTKVKVREKYRGLTRQEILDKTYELGSNFEKRSHSCSQSTAAAIHELLEMDDLVVKLATSLCGGSANQFLGTCGGLTAGIMVLDYFFGRPAEKMSYEKETQANIDAMVSAFEAPELLADRFWREYGTIQCINIHRQLFGRFYYAKDPDEADKLEKAGAHSDPTKCVHIVGNAARWVMEILLDKEAVEV